MAEIGVKCLLKRPAQLGIDRPPAPLGAADVLPRIRIHGASFTSNRRLRVGHALCAQCGAAGWCRVLHRCATQTLGQAVGLVLIAVIGRTYL